MAYAQEACAQAQAGIYSDGAKDATLAPRIPVFQGIIKRMDILRSRLTELSAMSNGVADKIVGPEPTNKSENDKIRPVANGCISELSGILTDLERLTEIAYSGVSRIGKEF